MEPLFQLDRYNPQDKELELLWNTENNMILQDTEYMFRIKDIDLRDMETMLATQWFHLDNYIEHPK
jgi:hypothetical protein